VGEVEADVSEIALWDPEFTKGINDKVGSLIKRYLRAEVRGSKSLPARGALVVSNHSGGAHTNDELALRSGGVVLVFPGGKYDSYRPTSVESHIDFHIAAKFGKKPDVEGSTPTCGWS